MSDTRGNDEGCWCSGRGEDEQTAASMREEESSGGGRDERPPGAPDKAGVPDLPIKSMLPETHTRRSPPESHLTDVRPVKVYVLHTTGSEVLGVFADRPSALANVKERRKTDSRFEELEDCGVWWIKETELEQAHVLPRPVLVSLAVNRIIHIFHKCREEPRTWDMPNQIQAEIEKVIDEVQT